jgi:hypothetical protein
VDGNVMAKKNNKNDSLVREAQRAYTEAKSAITSWNDESLVDMRFYLSEQWDSADEQKLKNKGIPTLNLNYIKKSVDLLSGYQRQNRGDIKYYPIEGGDTLVSEVLSKIAHWVMKNNGSKYYLSEAFKEALITGVGWFYPEIDYSKDPVNGDIYIRQESSFNMLFDPYFTEVDLSDCDYIIRHKLMSVRKAKQLWPEYKDEIDSRKGAKSDYSFRQDANVPSDRGDQILVWEYWYRDYVEKKYMFDEETSDLIEIEEGQEEMVEDQELDIITRKVPMIKLAIIVGDSTEGGQGCVVYEGDSPYSTQEYPFIPIWCYLTNSYSMWEKKLQGIIRTLRDPQREKNKRRSQIMHILNSVASSGYDIEKGAYDDINSFNKGGAGQVRLRNPGRNPAMRIPSPELPSAFVTLEQMFDQDITMIGANPDLLGMISEKGAPGITIQLRQKQGMTAVQEIFDNLAMAVQKFGRILVEMIVGNFSQEKVERILGEEVPYQNEMKQLEGQIQGMTMQLQQGAQALQEMAGREVRGEELGDQQAMQAVDQMNREEQMFEQQLMEMNNQLQDMQQRYQMLQAAQQEFWNKWEDLEKNSRYDCTVTEVMESETYRIAVLSSLTQLQQYGMQLPPSLFMRYLDLPEEDKREIMEFQQAQQQMAMQAQQQQSQGKMQIEQQKAQNSKDIALINQGIITPETMQ